MADEAPQVKPRLPTPDVLEAVRQLLPPGFRCNDHQVADSPDVHVRIRTLDHETYVRVTLEQRELMAGFGDAIKPTIDEIVAAFTRLAPAPPVEASMVVHPTPSPSPLPDPTPEPPQDP